MLMSSSTLRVISKFSRQEQNHRIGRMARPDKGVEFADSKRHALDDSRACHKNGLHRMALASVPPVVRMFANGGAAITDLFRPAGAWPSSGDLATHR